MKKNPAVFIAHILECINEIEEYVEGMELPAFIEDRRTQNAVVRLLEVIGEAAKHVPDEFRTQHPEVPWKKMTGMRDVITHEYFAVDLAIVWNVVQRELPKLKAQLLRLME